MKLTKKSIPAILLGLFAVGILFPAYKDSLVVESHTLFILLMVSRVLLVLLLLSAIGTLYLLKREDIFHFQLRIGFVALFILDAAVFFLREPDDLANVFISILLVLLGYLVPLERSLKLATLLPYSVALVIEVAFYKELDFFTQGSIALVIGVENLVGLLSMRKDPVIAPPFYSFCSFSIAGGRNGSRTKTGTRTREGSREDSYHLQGTDRVTP